MGVFKDTLAIIRYHTWWPGSGDPYYQYNIPENTARINYYGINVVPRLKINGNITGGSVSQWSAQISNEINVTAPLDIEITGEYSNANRTGNLDITVAATDVISYSNLRLRMAITESNIYWHAPNSSDWHHQVFRDMLPNTSGISMSISNGDTLTFEQDFSLPTQLNKYECEVVVFVQSDNGKRILQGARKSILEFQPLYELVHFDLLAPENGDTIRSCFPSFEWEASDDPDSGFAVSYLVEMDPSPSFSNPILSDTLSDTTWVSPYCLINDTTYYWRVKAFNGHAPDIYSNDIYQFRILEYGAITGTVTDDSSNVLEGVLVVLSGTGRSDTTDFAGEYSFNDLDEGSYDIDFSYSGYRDTTLTDIIVTSANTTIADVVMSEFGCVYAPGDANGSGSANGLDVIYLVSYFKGGDPPPDTCMCDPHGPLFVAADANGSCSVNGLDVTYLVSYFKGTGEIMFCEDCPPSQ